MLEVMVDNNPFIYRGKNTAIYLQTLSFMDKNIDIIDR